MEKDYGGVGGEDGVVRGYWFLGFVAPGVIKVMGGGHVLYSVPVV